MAASGMYGRLHGCSTAQPASMHRKHQLKVKHAAHTLRGMRACVRARMHCTRACLLACTCGQACTPTGCAHAYRQYIRRLLASGSACNGDFPHPLTLAFPVAMRAYAHALPLPCMRAATQYPTLTAHKTLTQHASASRSAPRTLCAPTTHTCIHLQNPVDKARQRPPASSRPNTALPASGKRPPTTPTHAAKRPLSQQQPRAGALGGVREGWWCARVDVLLAPGHEAARPEYRELLCTGGASPEGTVGLGRAPGSSLWLDTPFLATTLCTRSHAVTMLQARAQGHCWPHTQAALPSPTSMGCSPRSSRCTH